MLNAQGRLQPGVMIIGSFILFVLFLTGVIATAIQLFGDGSVNDSCNRFVYDNESDGPTITTLAWLQQKNICTCDICASPVSLFDEVLILCACRFCFLGPLANICIFILGSQATAGLQPFRSGSWDPFFSSG